MRKCRHRDLTTLESLSRAATVRGGASTFCRECQSNVPAASQAPRVKQLRSVCLSVSVTIGWGCSQGLEGAWDGESGRNPNSRGVSPALSPISLGIDRVQPSVNELRSGQFGFVTAHGGCTEHRWLWRVHSVSGQVAAGDRNVREILKFFFFPDKNVTGALNRTKIMIHINSTRILWQCQRALT